MENASHEERFKKLRCDLLFCLTGGKMLSGLEIVTTLPREGVVKLDEDEWRYRKHGFGFTFVSSNGDVVDILRADLNAEEFSDEELEMFIESQYR